MAIDVAKNKANFIGLVKAYIHRPGVDELLAFLEASDFYSAPASTRFHGAEDGGLCAHSIAVGKQMLTIADTFAPGIYDKESLVIVSLLHDLTKCNFYKRDTRNVKNEETGKWEKVPTFVVEDQFPYGHGEKSVYLLMRMGFKLTDEEAMAIRWHMGAFDEAVRGGSRAMQDAYERFPLAWMLHVADEAATYIDKM